MIRFLCPACRGHLSAPDEARGKTGTCPHCSAPVTFGDQLTILAPKRSGGTRAFVRADVLPPAAPVEKMPAPDQKDAIQGRRTLQDPRAVTARPGEVEPSRTRLTGLAHEAAVAAVRAGDLAAFEAIARAAGLDPSEELPSLLREGDSPAPPTERMAVSAPAATLKPVPRTDSPQGVKPDASKRSSSRRGRRFIRSLRRGAIGSARGGRLDAAMVPSYLGHAIGVMLVYLIGGLGGWIGLCCCWILGLVLNIVCLKSADRVRRQTGVTPEGRGCLVALLWFFTIGQLFIAILVLVAIRVFGGTVREKFQGSNTTVNSELNTAP